MGEILFVASGVGSFGAGMILDCTGVMLRPKLDRAVERPGGSIGVLVLAGGKTVF